MLWRERSQLTRVSYAQLAWFSKLVGLLELWVENIPKISLFVTCVMCVDSAATNIILFL